MARSAKPAGEAIPRQQALMDTINEKPNPSLSDITEETGRKGSTRCAAGSRMLLHVGFKKERAHPDTPRAERTRRPAEGDGGCDRMMPRAPFQLFAEFLKSVMGKDYTRARELCQTILIYEPENPEAKQFIPLIEEKLQMEQDEGWREEDEDSDVSEESEDMSDSNCSNADDAAVSSESSAEEEERSHQT